MRMRTVSVRKAQHAANLLPAAGAALCSVRIRPTATSGSVTYLNLREVQLFSAAGLLQPKASLIPFLTTTGFGYSASICFDGDITNDMLPCLTLDTTSGDRYPSMSIQYPCETGATSLSKVVVYNRMTVPDRLNSFTLVFMNVARSQDRPTYAFAGSLAVYQIPA
jgi:hypothetical protein